MEKIRTDLYQAAKFVLNPRKVSDVVEAGGVGALGELTPEWRL